MENKLLPAEIPSKQPNTNSANQIVLTFLEIDC